MDSYWNENILRVQDYILNLMIKWQWNFKVLILSETTRSQYENCHFPKFSSAEIKKDLARDTTAKYQGFGLLSMRLDLKAEMFPSNSMIPRYKSCVLVLHIHCIKICRFKIGV